MGSAAFDYQITFNAGFYKLDQPGNLGLILDVEAAETNIKTHPTNADWFYFNAITLDWRRCTNIAAASREALMDAIVALNTLPPPPGVTDVNLVQVGGAAITEGQKLMAASLPVVIASDQSTINTAVTNFPALQNVNLTQVGGAAYTEGQKLMAASAPVVIASDQSAIPVTQSTTPWVVNETQIGGAAYTLGQKTMANSAPVVLASDQSAIPVTLTNTQVQGFAAHDSAISGNPVQIGFRANANEPTAVTDGDNVYGWANPFGALVVVDGHPTPNAPSIVSATAAGDTTLLAAPGAGSIYLQKIDFGAISVGGGGPRIVSLREGAGGTIRFRCEVNQGLSNSSTTHVEFGMAGWKLPATTALVANLDVAQRVDFNMTQYYVAP